MQNIWHIHAIYTHIKEDTPQNTLHNTHTHFSINNHQYYYYCVHTQMIQINASMLRCGVVASRMQKILLAIRIEVECKWSRNRLQIDTIYLLNVDINFISNLKCERSDAGDRGLDMEKNIPVTNPKKLIAETKLTKQESEAHKREGWMQNKPKKCCDSRASKRKAVFKSQTKPKTSFTLKVSFSVYWARQENQTECARLPKKTYARQ